MCPRKCSRCIAGTLYPLVLLSIICNIVLFFPGWDVKFVKDGHITQEVKYLGGLVGGGLLMLIPARFIQHVGENESCCNCCGMLLSTVVAVVGGVGALYSLVVAAVGLSNGPLCFNGGNWTRPFKNSNYNYLTDRKSWEKCEMPKNVVEFNAGLFGTLIAASCLQGFLCFIQMFNGVCGCLCAPWNNLGTSLQHAYNKRRNETELPL